MNPVVIACLCGIIIGSALSAVVGLWLPRRAVGAVATQKALGAVNVFHGTVFPDPRDPRWRQDGTDGNSAPLLRFGDSDITLGCIWLRVGAVEVERGLGTAGLYYDAVQEARTEATKQRALASVEISVRAAGEIVDKPQPPRQKAIDSSNRPVWFEPFEVDGHVLPAASDSRWELQNGRINGIWFWTGNMGLGAYVDGEVRLGGDIWFRHAAVKAFVQAVRERLEPIEKAGKEAARAKAILDMEAMARGRS